MCSSIGASMLFYPAMSSIGTWFFKRRAFAFGVMAAGSSLGGVCPSLLQFSDGAISDYVFLHR